MAVVPRGKRRILPWVLGAIVVTIAAVLAWRGWDFYRLGIEQRPDHPDFRKLRPSGAIGNGYGYAGALLVFMNLSYLVRRLIPSARLGSMRTWLDLHVFTGLLAAVLVSFHSAFQLRTPIATWTSISLAIVVATGLLGRFLYALSPAGQARRLGAALDALDDALPGTRDPIGIAIGQLPGPVVAPNASFLISLATMPRWRRVSRQRREAIALIVADRDPPRAVRPLIRAVQKAAAADARSSGAAALLRSWRGLHRFFAILMLLAVGLHIGVAWHYGYRWIFS
jgi:dihydropyrimidine dehydrogenase (NAD+) subunit PreT